jgi:hypothetical protein
MLGKAQEKLVVNDNANEYTLVKKKMTGWRERCHPKATRRHTLSDDPSGAGPTMEEIWL